MMDLPNMSLHVILLLLLPSNVAAWHGSNRGPNDHGILQIFLHLVTVAFLQPWRRKRNHRICKLPTMDNIYIKNIFRTGNSCVFCSIAMYYQHAPWGCPLRWHIRCICWKPPLEGIFHMVSWGNDAENPWFPQTTQAGFYVSWRVNLIFSHSTHKITTIYLLHP